MHREAFFQAVSNSAWANFGYLVTKDISDKTMPELQILASLPGIGVIRLDRDLPSKKRIADSSTRKNRSGLDKCQPIG